MVEVRDRGCARTRPGEASGASAGTGIAGMRQRAAAVGGRLDAGPDPEGGFVVRAELPLTTTASVEGVTS